MRVPVPAGCVATSRRTHRPALATSPSSPAASRRSAGPTTTPRWRLSERSRGRRRCAAALNLRVVLLCALACSAALHRYEYVFPDRQVDVYDIDHGFRLVQQWSIPEAHALRGVAVSPKTQRLYFSVGGNGGPSGKGTVFAYDLARRHVLWVRHFSTGTDSLAVTPNGKMLFVPEGERSFGNVWYVLDAATGRVVHEIHAGPGPHNTIVAPDGRLVYLGPRNSRWLYVASTATDRIVRRVCPLKPGVRPFTIDGAQRYAFTTATGVVGFQVSSLRTGRVLYNVRLPVQRATGGTPSHGISI